MELISFEVYEAWLLNYWGDCLKLARPSGKEGGKLSFCCRFIITSYYFCPFCVIVASLYIMLCYVCHCKYTL